MGNTSFTENKGRKIVMCLRDKTTDIDGLMMASLMPQGFDEDRMGAMSAAMLSLGDRTAQELARGTLEQVLIKGNQGFVDS